MDFRRFVVLVSVVGLVFFGCREEVNRFSISGKISHAEGKVVYLEELLVSSSKVIDSTKIGKNGGFEFKGTTNLPTYYLLKLNDNKFITLLVDSLEQVVVEADIANFERDYNIQGSEGSVQVKMLNDHLYDTKHKLDSLKSLMSLYRGNPDFESQRAQWEEESARIQNEQVEFSTRFVMDNPFSMASVLALYQKFDNQNFVLNDIQVMRVAASALNSIYPQSGHVKALYQNTVQLLKEERSAQLQRFIQEQGDNSPDIVLPDENGNEIALSSLRGKIVLLHFWSAVDRNSRIMNQALVEAYRKYSNRGFEIFQVSVDTDRIEWIDAIDHDQLTWINVGDMEGSRHATNSYNIRSVPYNYLLDREGMVVARDLKGQALDNAISNLLK
ncbi:MAG: TlpA disulfide reductase family protein [Prolixibacteraceae bacterium]|jgi:peroxiredoxin|nr:TlpA disulfide reductase family protein [Prolixibacteraceae bacterium]MDD4755150.1 TlpA disulfide reductase family protein [Prolixibacteraceae bacterium]